MLNEADTRAKLIDPKLQRSGWTEKMIVRDKAITKGMIINESGDRLPVRKPDYILRYPDKDGIPIAVVEAEAEGKSHLAGMQQAKEYMERLGVRFAYSTNGHKIEEYDDFRKQQVTLENFPSPDELWRRYVEGKELKGVVEIKESPLLYSYYPLPDKPLRYYQEVAIRNAIEAILKGKKKLLLTMATGSGKTYVAFQIAWKLYKTKRIRRILYLVDRIFLRRQAHDMFFPFGATTGKTAYVESLPFKKVAVNEHVFIVRSLDESRLLNKYLFFVLFSEIGQKQIRDLFHGTAQGGITQRNVEEISIPLPPLEEQKRIIVYLDKLRETIESIRGLQQKTKDELEKLIPSILDKAFKGGL